MKLSIITVTYNSADTLEETILSVLNQNYEDVEYIIVDGQSSDGTAAILKKYEGRVSRIISEKDRGLYDALNKGIDLASGDVIGILHSDDFYIDKDVLRKYAELFTEKKVDAVYSDLYYVDKNNPDKIIRKWKSGNYKPNAFVNGWMPPHPTFFVKKDIYRKFGKFNLDFKTAADYELMLRFIQGHNISIAYLPEYTVKMRVGGKSNLSLTNRFKANMEDRKAWEVNGLKPRFYTLYLKPFLKLFQFF
ncbi:MAG: glycosyltransferase family 2 protein [bacterium]|nr:glycosyltransferase family 2 protein [bacterium]